MIANFSIRCLIRAISYHKRLELSNDILKNLSMGSSSSDLALTNGLRVEQVSYFNGRALIT